MPISTDELLDRACPVIRDNGWAYYFVPGTVARGEELGLDGASFYVMGRGGVLGDVEWQVVHSAFGYFNPELVKAVWNAGREKIAPRQAGREYLACCQAFGRERLSDTPGLEAFCAAAGAVNAAAEVPGLTLYAAAAAEPLPTDPPALAMQLMSVLRELRGSAHLLAIVASELTPKEAHYLQRPDFMGMFGWPEGDVPEVTEEHRRRLEAAEALTDRLVAPAYSVLDDDGRRALLDGLDGIVAAITG